MNDNAAVGETRRRLFVYNGGFLTKKRIRRMLDLAGWDVRLGKPGSQDWVGVWGKSPTAGRGETVARATASQILTVEDAFLRSVLPGRAGSPPLGLHLDTRGAHFDCAQPSDLEHLLATAPLDDTALLNRARDAISRLRRAHLSKYNAFNPATPLPDPGYVLVIDQTRGDASITHGAGSETLFDEMLAFAQIEHPGAKILLKTHPETQQGHRRGHYSACHEDSRTRLYTDAISPWALLEGAIAVYTVTSQLGFEAILAGHKPRVFGQPFYGGWGLSQDENPCPRRERKLTRAQLFAAAMILYPIWYNPFRDELCTLETAIDVLEAETRAWRQDHRGHVASGMRLWKRKPLQQVFGRYKPLIFEDDPHRASALAKNTGRGLLVWAGKEDTAHHGAILRVEDGFLRSRGLGATLIPPLSLVADNLGIYYDPSRPSRLEQMIAESCRLTPSEIEHSRRIIADIATLKLSKYNIGAKSLPDLKSGHRILVPGQVENDASIKRGCTHCVTNLDLLMQTRINNPDAVIIYKPHPDVEAGLRAGKVDQATALEHADHVITGADSIVLIEQVQEVWTMTSLLGFEALLRRRRVTTLGAPFYAGWGLTHDLGDVPARRTARPSLEQLAHAVLIGYPRYFDPVTKMPCPVDVVIDRLATGTVPRPGPANRLLSKLQGVLASRAHLWR
ncbi:capsular polysaccharide biosynthesis protein [Oceaniglobus ichthyenteri]|uniref:capsular polysaccharide biosynthesis protein n=1 Tax=Oceaniglobus ichthyenteri TaxID=2136177 RepID=UPI000D3AEF79|nr:capsular polysaccharide biosynthesis protein [Oceaniglobus ichthyenteri]